MGEVEGPAFVAMTGTELATLDHRQLTVVRPTNQAAFMLLTYRA